jgi:uncharacterized protein (DUF58 family)
LAAGARSPEALLRRIELRLGRRLDGLLEGEHRSRRSGAGTEEAITRAYEPGDDVRWVDWRLSARRGFPMVRVPQRDPLLTAWALLDCSPSMAFGSQVQTKLELAQEVLAALAGLLRRRGDRLGIAATRGERLDLVRPPTADRRGLVAALGAVEALEPPEAGAGRTDLGRAVASLGRVARERGLVVVLSDLPLQSGLERSLGALGRRHDLIVVEVRDPRERELPAMGPLALVDLETGRRVSVDTADRRFRDRFAGAVSDADARRRALVARARASHVVVSTDADWVLPLARALARPGPRARR